MVFCWWSLGTLLGGFRVDWFRAGDSTASMLVYSLPINTEAEGSKIKASKQMFLKSRSSGQTYERLAPTPAASDTPFAVPTTKLGQNE